MEKISKLHKIGGTNLTGFKVS